MSKTPFIRTLVEQGGTFYTFSSAAEDLSFTFNNSNSKFRFSKFALLNLPNFDTSYNGDKNIIRLNAPDTAFLDWAENNGNLIKGDPNETFSQSFQSYCLNLETNLINRNDYNPGEKENLSERVFFKWLKEIGAIRWKNREVTQGPDKTYTEEIESNDYNRVVQYIGDLDIVNSIRSKDNSYTEVYVYVPTKNGNTPYILFNSFTSNINYPTNIILENGNDGKLFNRSSGEINPGGLEIQGIFDCEHPGLVISSWENIETGATGGNWYGNGLEHSYFTEKTFGDPTNSRIKKENQDKSIELTYIRSNLDSVGINFKEEDYLKMVQNRINFDTFNSSEDSKDFDFNTILIYYDVYDPSNPEIYSTNLYGVLFLNNIGVEGIMDRFKKNKPNKASKLNGNSYGFKLNIKFDTGIDQTGVEQAINDYSPFSLSMFMDAMNIFQESSSLFNKNISNIISIDNRLKKLENLFLTESTKSDLEKKINMLENSYISNQALFSNTKSIIKLINQNYDLYSSIINNKTNIKMSYDLDLIKSGKGINVDRDIPNQLILNNINECFNIGPNNGYSTLVQGDNIIDLVEYSNYFKHINNGNNMVLSSDLIIKINDSQIKWKRGQKFRISFGDRMFLGNYNINILTNSIGDYPKNNPTNIAYSKLIISLDDIIFNEFDNMPVIEIICIDDDTLKFQVDIIGKSLTNNQ